MSIDKKFFQRADNSHAKGISKGFLLIELIITILLFSVAMLMIFQYKWGIMRLNENAARRMRAIGVAAGVIEEICAQKKISFLWKEMQGYRIEVRENPLYFSRITVPPFLQKKKKKHIYDLRKIDVIVQWKALSGKEMSFAIATVLML